MNDENIKRLRLIILDRGAFIHNKLPPHPNHPHGRIGVAHLYAVIKSVMGVPLKQCGDDRFDDIVDIINYCVDNVNVREGLTSPLHEKYNKEQIPYPNTLDMFM